MDDDKNNQINLKQVAQPSTNTCEDEPGQYTAMKSIKALSGNETGHNATCAIKADPTSANGNQQKLGQPRPLSFYRNLTKICDTKMRESPDFVLKNTNSNTDAFPFLRQTSSGRIVKRTQLAALNSKEFLVDRPARAKSTSPKHKGISFCFTNLLALKLLEPSDEIVPATRRNSTGSVTVSNEDVSSFSVPDEPTLHIKSEYVNGSDDNDKKLDVEMMSIEETVQNSLLHVKLDHDYDEKKPVFSDNENVKEEMQVEDNICIKREIEIDNYTDNGNVSGEDKNMKEMMLPCTQDVKMEIDSLNKKEEPGRNRKKARLSSEVRTLIDESIKATKTLNFPTSRLRRPRSLRNKQRRTECEMLLDMLTENPGPDNLIRIKNRNLPKQFVGNNNALNKNIPKANKIQKLPSPKIKDEIKKEAANTSLQETPVKARDKKLIAPLVAQKNKAIKMKLKLEKKKKKASFNKDGVNSFDTKNAEIAKPFKSIVLQDLKEKVKAKMEKTEKNSPELKCGEIITYLAQRRPPGRPRIHHNPQLPKPAKVSRHGRILGRPRKSSDAIKDVNKLSAESIFSIDQTGCFLKVPYVAISPNPVLRKRCLLQTKVKLSKDDVGIEKTCNVELKDCGRQRSSQRQAESSYKYKDIAVKFHKDFAQIILLFSLANPKSGLNPQVLKELKRAFLATAKDNNCKVVLLNGVGNTFCSGIDLTYIMKENKEQRQKAVEDMVTAMRDFLRTLISFPKPVVVAVNGLARGLGVGLLLLCDIIYASDKAVFEMPYSQLGQVPEGCASITLLKNLSISMVNDLLFTGRRLTASEAQQCGLVSQVFWPNDLLEQVLPRVQKMAAQNGMETTKALLRQKMKSELDTSLENECQLLMNQWSHPECQKSIKEFVEQPFP